MKGDMVVARDASAAAKLLAARKPTVIQNWKVTDFPDLSVKKDEASITRGMLAFTRARCTQCHEIAGHGINLGPELCDVVERYKGDKLLRQILEPSSEIPEKFRNQTLVLASGRVVTGVVMKEEKGEVHVVANLLTPHSVTRIAVKDIDERVTSKVSPMPDGLANVLTREEILDLLAFLESASKLPKHLMHTPGSKPGK